jgi:four helix bundle protein
MGARRIHDLTVWRVASELAGAVFVATCAAPFEKDWKFRDQLRSAAVAIPANIAEGFGRFRPAEFARFLLIARASALELESHLAEAVRRRWLDGETAAGIRLKAERTIIGITRLHAYLRSCPPEGAGASPSRASKRKIRNSRAP